MSKVGAASSVSWGVGCQYFVFIHWCCSACVGTRTAFHTIGFVNVLRTQIQYCAPYRQNRHVAFLPACMTTSGRIHGEFLRLLYFISNKQAVDYFEALGYDAHKAKFCHRRGVFFHNHRCTLGMACAQAVAMRGAPSAARRLVAAPRNQQPFRFDPHVFDRDFSHLDDVG